MDEKATEANRAWPDDAPTAIARLWTAESSLRARCGTVALAASTIRRRRGSSRRLLLAVNMAADCDRLTGTIVPSLYLKYKLEVSISG